MPSSITHQFIGIDIKNKLNEKCQNIINKHVNNYRLYCQGMDVLYFYHIFMLKGNKIVDLGHEFHRDNIYRNFKYLIDINKENKDEELFTFIAGLITHYVADSTMHPLINYISDKYNVNKTKLGMTNNHFEVETYLDNYYLNKNNYTNYKTFNNYKLVFDYTKENIIIETINKLFKNYYNEDNIGNLYYKAASEMKFTFKYIRHDRFGIKKQLYKLIDLNTLNVRRTKYLSYHFDLNNDNKYRFNDNSEWYYIHDKNIKSNKSMSELYEDVINKGSNIINKLYDYIYLDKDINLEEIIENRSLSSGLLLK